MLIICISRDGRMDSKVGSLHAILADLDNFLVSLRLHGSIGRRNANNWVFTLGRRNTIPVKEEVKIERIRWQKVAE